jgi:site-specific DNA-methyltransferase (adenine-specific)
MKHKIKCGDCLALLRDITTGSVDMVLCDLPYGTTQNKWDSVIPFAPLWDSYRRVLKATGVVALTASQPFTSALVMSNLEWFKHEWIWIKNRGSNFANTVREPFKEHESVLIFSPGKWTYNKQMQERGGTGADRIKYNVAFRTGSENYREFTDRETNQLSEMRVPSSWQKFNTDTTRLHPTQKPVPLFEYLIHTYTNEGDTVLDSCCGSGTTGIACARTGRSSIQFDISQAYCDIAKKRLEAEPSSLFESLMYIDPQ